jgi:DNA-binding CsgD family transcriptional regulator
VKLSDTFTAASACRSRDELYSTVINFCHHLEFSTMTAMAVIDHADKEPAFSSVANPPAAFFDAYMDMDGGRRDPVMQHCKVSGVPIMWDQETYVRAGCAEMWEVQAPHGYKTGIAFALHLPFGRHFFIGFDRDQPLPNDPFHLTRMVADLQLFTVLAHEAGFRVLANDIESPRKIRRLTQRELECLRWTMEGKTAWEIGRILSISEQTAVRHINNATHKLACINKHQAVLKAIRLGLIR